MRSFDALDKSNKERAVRACLSDIVHGIVYGALVDVELVNPKNQRNLDYILSQVNETGEYRLGMLRIFNNKPIIEELSKLALVGAKIYRYNAMGDRIKEEGLQ